jgi:hypothetical protein
LDHTGNVVDALEAHAEQMAAAARQLRAIKDFVSGHRVRIDAGTHHIGISGTIPVMDRLVAEELAWEDEFDEEEDD